MQPVFADNLDFQNTGTLGLQLVNTLTNRLKGSIGLHSNGQTEFRIHNGSDTFY